MEPLEDVQGDEETKHWRELSVGPMADPIKYVALLEYIELDPFK